MGILQTGNRAILNKDISQISANELMSENKYVPSVISNTYLGSTRCHFGIYSGVVNQLVVRGI